MECTFLEPLMDSNPLDIVGTLYQLLFWVMITVVVFVWVLAMFLLLIPSNTRLHNFVLRLFISFDFQYEELKTHIDDEEVLGSSLAPSASHLQTTVPPDRRPRSRSKPQPWWKKRFSSALSIRSLKRQKRFHAGFAKIYHIQKSQTAIGGVITLFVLLFAIVLITNAVVTFFDPSRHVNQVYPSAIQITQEEDFDNNGNNPEVNGTLVPLNFYALFALFTNEPHNSANNINCEQLLSNIDLRVYFRAIGYSKEQVMDVRNLRISSYKLPEQCLIQWSSYIVLNPTYQRPYALLDKKTLVRNFLQEMASIMDSIDKDNEKRKLLLQTTETLLENEVNMFPNVYQFNVTWQRKIDTKMYLQELLMKSDVQYFNDDSGSERKTFQNNRFSKLLFSQKQYCIVYGNNTNVPSRSSDDSIVNIHAKITSYIFQKNWLLQRQQKEKQKQLTNADYLMPFCQTLSFPQTRRQKLRAPSDPNRHRQAIVLHVSDGDSFNVVFPSVLTLAMSIFSLLGGVVAVIPIARYFVNKFMKWFSDYWKFRVLAVLVFIAVSALGACSYFVLKNRFDRWIVLTISVLLTVIPLGSSIALVVHATYLILHAEDLKEKMDRYKTAAPESMSEVSSHIQEDRSSTDMEDITEIDENKILFGGKKVKFGTSAHKRYGT